jgi:DNA primase
MDSKMKTCNICNIEKPLDAFRIKSRRCIQCQYAINQEYSKQYYDLHRQRLQQVNKANYREKVKTIGKRGRPRNPLYYPTPETEIKEG